MTQQIACDECGKVIDQSQPYYEIGGTLMQMQGDPPQLTVVESVKILHYHQDHLPESVLDPANPGVTPPIVEPEPPDPDAPVVDNTLPEPEVPGEEPDPYPGVVIEEMTIQQVLQWVDDDLEKAQWALDQENVSESPRRSLTDQLENKLD